MSNAAIDLRFPLLDPVRPLAVGVVSFHDDYLQIAPDIRCVRSPQARVDYLADMIRAANDRLGSADLDHLLPHFLFPLRPSHATPTPTVAVMGAARSKQDHSHACALLLDFPEVRNKTSDTPKNGSAPYNFHDIVAQDLPKMATPGLHTSDKTKRPFQRMA